MSQINKQQIPKKDFFNFVINNRFINWLSQNKTSTYTKLIMNTQIIFMSTIFYQSINVLLKKYIQKHIEIKNNELYMTLRYHSYFFILLDRVIIFPIKDYLRIKMIQKYQINNKDKFRYLINFNAGALAAIIKITTQLCFKFSSRNKFPDFKTPYQRKLNQKKIIKYYKDYDKSMISCWFRIISQNNIGFIPRILSRSLHIGLFCMIFDTFQDFKPKELRYQFLVNFLVASFSNLIAYLITSPLGQLQILKRKSQNYASYELHFLKRYDSYPRLLKKFLADKQLFLKSYKQILSISSIWSTIQFGLVIATYQYFKQQYNKQNLEKSH